MRSEARPDALLAGKIRLLKRIGRGGMGEVWVAYNEATQAELAVKTLHRAERSPLHDQRFRREARLCATISHRNVVRVFDLVDEADGTLGLVMELLRGRTLEDTMAERGPLSSRQAVAVALPVLSAMHHVHQKGIVHRDMKPANVFFAVEPDGHVIPKILDFGIAKLPAGGSALTVDGSVLGTPHYMSPEQIRGQHDIDGRSDMFSFAVVIYEMLTGVRVFHRESASASLAAVLEHEVDPDPRIEPRLWLALSRALAKRPYERYASCAELADALRAAVGAGDEELAQALQELRPRTDVAEATSASLSSLEVAAERPRDDARNRRPRARTIGVAAALVGAALTAFAVLRPGPSSPPSSAASAGAQRSAISPATNVPPDRPSASAAATLVPPSPASAADPAPTASALAGAHEATAAAPALSGTPVRSAPRRTPPGATSDRRGPPSKGVATTPGF